MQTFQKKEDGHEYFYVYLEKLGRILVFKDKHRAYKMRLDWTGKLFGLACECEGDRWRRTCKHKKTVLKAFDFSREKRPRGLDGEIAEEYYINSIRVEEEGMYGQRINFRKSS